MDGDTRGREPHAVARPERLPRVPWWDAPVSRRGVVAAATLGAVTVLAGCGVRLDLPPDPAPTPTRRPAPDERYLLSVIADLTDVVASERRLVDSGAAGTVVPTLLPLHERQVTVLVGRLTNDGVPTTAIPTAAAPGTGAASTPAQLATRLADLTAKDWTELAAASPEHPRARRGGLRHETRGCRAARAPDHRPDHPDPRAAGAGGTDRPARLRLRGRRGPVEGGARERALATLSELRRLLEDVAGLPGATPELPGGWALPFPVTTPDEAARLASRTLSTAAATATDAAGPSPTPAPPSRTSRAGAPGSRALATTWGVPLVAFPGDGTHDP